MEKTKEEKQKEFELIVNLLPDEKRAELLLFAKYLQQKQNPEV